jgi:hypothetical protein
MAVNWFRSRAIPTLSAAGRLTVPIERYAMRKRSFAAAHVTAGKANDPDPGEREERGRKNEA